jgi:hypothetical protein
MTRATLPAVKDTHTPPRSIRIPDDLWNAAKAKAAERGETVTDVVVRALERYVKRPT